MLRRSRLLAAISISIGGSSCIRRDSRHPHSRLPRAESEHAGARSRQHFDSDLARARRKLRERFCGRIFHRVRGYFYRIDIAHVAGVYCWNSLLRKYCWMMPRTLVEK